MSAELFEAPFNLAGELIDNSTTAEGEARVRALAESEARKSQQTFFFSHGDDRRTLESAPLDMPLNDKEQSALDRESAREGVTFAAVSRWPMCGGGTAYSVRFFKRDKPTHPLHGSTYCTTVLTTFQGEHSEFFEVVDAIDPREHWTMDKGWEKYERFKRLQKVADRLAVRIAKRVFPEMKRERKLPSLWDTVTRKAEEHLVPVRLKLPA